jgi:hypothetical protein
MKKPLTLIYFSFLFSFVATAQNQSNDANKFFLFEKFADGTVLMKSGAKETASLNYNTENQSVVFQNNGQVMILTDLPSVDTIYINDKKFVPVGDKIYEVISGNGEAGLLANYTGKKHPMAATVDHNGNSKKSLNTVDNTVSSIYVNRNFQDLYSIEIMKNYFVRNKYKLFKANNEKQIAKIFPEKENDIKNYVSENHIDISKESDLIKLIAYCNTQQ